MSKATTAADAATRYCIGCGYILDHLPEPRCPECGREFDPEDLRSFTKINPADWQRIRRRGLTGLILVILSAAPGLGIWLMPGFVPKMLSALPCLVVLGSGCLMLQDALDKNILFFHRLNRHPGVFRDFCELGELFLILALLCVATVCGIMMAGMLGILVAAACRGS
jgi:hypothetical protein